MKINFSKIQLKNLDGVVMVDPETKKPAQIHKTLANAIYRKTNSLDLVEIAREINKAKEVDLSKSDIDEIKNIILAKSSGFFAFAKRAILDHIKQAGMINNKNK